MAFRVSNNSLHLGHWTSNESVTKWLKRNFFWYNLLGFSLAAEALLSTHHKEGSSVKKHLVTLLLMIFIAAFINTTFAAEQNAQKNKMPAIEESSVATVKATVQAVDLKKRTVTLKGPEGKVVTIKVDNSVKNLPQVKVGDEVVAKYYQAVAIQVKKPGQAQAGASAQEAVATAKPGEKPAGVAINTVTVTTVIEKIDAKDHTVTLKGPEGNTETVKVKNPKHLENVKVGDEVVITYTQALAIAVEKPK